MSYYTKLDANSLVPVVPVVYNSVGDVPVSKGVQRDATIAELGTLIATAGVSPATTATAGVVKQAAAQVDSVATTVADLVIDFNALLAKLRTAGIMA